MKNMVVSEGDEQVCVSAPLDKEAFATPAIPSEEPHIIFDSVPTLLLEHDHYCRGSCPPYRRDACLVW